MSTFTQQSIRSVSCQRDAPGQSASIPVAQAAIKDTEWTYLEKPQLDYNTGFDAAMKSALIAGLADLQTANSLPFDCSSGNCSFPSYGGITHSTLVLEGECVDISNLIVQADFGNLTTYTLPGLATLTYSWAFDNYSLAEHQLNQDLPIQWGKPRYGVGGPYLYATIGAKSAYNINYTTPLLLTHDFALLMPTTSPCQDPLDYPLYTQKSFEPLPRIDANTCGFNMPNVSTLPGFYGLTAVACHISPVLQRYSGSVVGGQLVETSTLNGPISLQPVMDNTSMEKAEEGKTSPQYFTFLDPCYIDGIPYTASNFSSASGDTFSVLDESGAVVTGPEVCFYGISNHWAASLDRLILQWFRDHSCIATPNETNIVCDNWWLENLYNGRNSSVQSVTAAVKAAAQYMSNHLRNVGKDWKGDGTTVTGTVQQTSICVEFHWPWLLVPAGLILGVASVLAAMIAETNTMNDRWGLWKGSVLPLLLYGVEERARKSGLLSGENLEDAAKTMQVSFSSDDQSARILDETRHPLQHPLQHQHQNQIRKRSQNQPQYQTQHQPQRQPQNQNQHQPQKWRFRKNGGNGMQASN